MDQLPEHQHLGVVRKAVSDPTQVLSSGICIFNRILSMTVWRFLKKLKIEVPYDPVILLLGIYPDKTII